MLDCDFKSVVLDNSGEAPEASPQEGRREVIRSAALGRPDHTWHPRAQCPTCGKEVQLDGFWVQTEEGFLVAQQ